MKMRENARKLKVGIIRGESMSYFSFKESSFRGEDYSLALHFDMFVRTRFDHFNCDCLPAHLYTQQRISRALTYRTLCVRVTRIVRVYAYDADEFKATFKPYRA